MKLNCIRKKINVFFLYLQDISNLIGRFRGNLIVSGGEAFEEDSWKSIEIGDNKFQVRTKISWLRMELWIRQNCLVSGCHEVNDYCVYCVKSFELLQPNNEYRK